MLDTASNRLANSLSGLGIGRGDRVAVMLPNHPDHVDTIVALAKLGATHVPVNVHAKELGLRYQLEHSEPRAVIADARYQAELSRALRGVALETLVWRGQALGDGDDQSRSFE